MNVARRVREVQNHPYVYTGATFILEDFVMIADYLLRDLKNESILTVGQEITYKHFLEDIQNDKRKRAEEFVRWLEILK